MKKLTNTTYSYQALDGVVFDTEAECQLHEAKIPPALRYWLEQGYKDSDMDTEGYWQLGYTDSWTTTEYESPGFLREGGEYQVAHSNDNVLGVVHGYLYDAINYALTTKWAYNKGKFIRKIEIKEV